MIIRCFAVVGLLFLSVTNSALALEWEVRLQRKISDITGSLMKYEASGVTSDMQGNVVIVFDNLDRPIKVTPQFTGVIESSLKAPEQTDFGFEGVTYLNYNGRSRYYALIESMRIGKKKYGARIVEFDDDFNVIESNPVDYVLKSKNKGFEGIDFIIKDQQLYMLMLCEGNKCKRGREAREPGSGRIVVFKKVRNKWRAVGEIKLPRTLLFKDFSGLDIKGNSIAIASQESGAIWLSTLFSTTNSDGTIDWNLNADGQILQLKNEFNYYCNIEGVTIVSPTILWLVTDKVNKGQSPACDENDQSILKLKIFAHK